MSVFIYQDSSELSLTDLVIRAFEPNDGPAPEDLEIERSAGPPLLGLDTEWHRWTFREGVSSLLIPSALDEPDDEDDQPYPCRSGLIARADGTTTAYVATNDEKHSVYKHKLIEAVLEAANSEIFTPMMDKEKPIPDELLDLRKELELAFGEENSQGLHAKVEVFANHYWVQVRFANGSDLLIYLSEEGIRLWYLTEVYLDVKNWSEDKIDEYVKDKTISEFEPLLKKLGFNRDDGWASSSEESKYKGADVVGWNLPMKRDIPAVVSIVHDLAVLENPLIEDIEEDMVD